MSDTAEIIRPILFVIRLFLWISAVIVMGLTAWAVTHLKGYRTVYTLVIAVLATAFYIPSFFTSLMRHNRGYMLPLDIIFYALYVGTHYHSYISKNPELDIEVKHRWLAAFIFVAQTDNLLNGDHIGCHFYVWNLASGCMRRNAIEAFTFLSFFWTLCGLCLEIANLYLYGRSSMESPPATHPQKPAVAQTSSPGANTGTNGTGNAPATTV